MHSLNSMESVQFVLYNELMSNILLIGKDLPDGIDFAKALLQDENTLFAAESDSSTASEDFDEKIFTGSWNKSSAISAHSFLIKAETKLQGLKKVILYFDADYFSNHFGDGKSNDIAEAIDTMITPFLYITDELLKRADQKKDRLTVAFLLKNQDEEKTSGIVSIAQAAFCQLAQNFCKNINSREYLRIFLAKNMAASDNISSEAQLAGWLLKGMEETSELAKQTEKQAASWIKAGAKTGKAFPFFK